MIFSVVIQMLYRTTYLKRKKQPKIESTSFISSKYLHRKNDKYHIWTLIYKYILITEDTLTCGKTLPFNWP